MTENQKLDFSNFIKTELNGCNGYTFVEKTINELITAITPHKSFNFEKFKEWFISKKISKMDYPVSFLKKCALADVNKGNFDDVSEITSTKINVSIQTLLNAMRLNGIEIINHHEIFIDIVENYIAENGLMTLDELIVWNHKAVAYLANDNKTSEDFIYLFKNTRDMRSLNLPISELEAMYEKEREGWVKLLEKTATQE